MSCCCQPIIHCGGTCSIAFTVIELCGGPGGSATITYTYGEDCSVERTVVEDGVTLTFDGPDNSSKVTVTYGLCSYTDYFPCGIPVTLYYCSATCSYSAAASVTWIATGDVVSMTDGTDTGLGYWESPSPGEAVFCYLYPFLPLMGNDAGSCGYGYAIGEISYRHAYTCGYISSDTGSGYGYGYDYGYGYGSNGYYESCDPPIPVCCCAENSYNPIFYPISEYIVGPCDATICSLAAGIPGVLQGCVDASNALPKCVSAVILGCGSLGEDAGEPISLLWVSGDGTGTPCDGMPIIYQSECGGPNGAGGQCYSVNRFTGEVTLGDIIYYQSHQVTLKIMCYGTNVIGTLSYMNYWNPGCPSDDPPPVNPCPGQSFSPGLAYCEQISSGVPNYQFLPMNISFTLCLAGDCGPGMISFAACAPVDWQNFTCSFTPPRPCRLGLPNCQISPCSGPMMNISTELRPIYSVEYEPTKRSRWR